MERVIIDTSVWSLFVRRRSHHLSQNERRRVLDLRRIVTEGLAVLVGVVRQELLTGVRHGEAFERLRQHLRYFDDEVPDVADYERAAQFDNACQVGGIAASTVDMLLCAISHHRDLPIFTTDPDFERYRKVLTIRLYRPRSR